MSPDAYMLAGSMRDARTTALHDCGWHQITPVDFITPSNERVRVVGHADDLRGLPLNTKVYLGHNWFMTDSFALRFLQSGRFRLVDAPVCRAPEPEGRIVH